LADVLGLHKTKVSYATRELRDRGLIERDGGDNKNGFPLVLTDRGKNLVVVAADVYREAI
jgi:DNA-binding MarR family transcriptional regulator